MPAPADRHEAVNEQWQWQQREKVRAAKTRNHHNIADVVGIEPTRDDGSDRPARDVFVSALRTPNS